MIDGFILLAPLLLLAIVLLFVFTGCTSTLSGASIPLILRANLMHRGRRPTDTAFVYFSWTIERGHELLVDDGYGRVREPATNNAIDVYDYAPPDPQAGIWTVWCARNVFVEGAVIPGEVGPESGCQFPYYGEQKIVTFEIVRDGEGGWLVQKASENSGCE